MDVSEKLAAIGCDPIEGMAKLAMDSTQPAALRFRCLAELAQYVYPKRKPVDIAVEQDSVVNVNTILNLAQGPANVGNEPINKP